MLTVSTNGLFFFTSTLRHEEKKLQKKQKMCETLSFLTLTVFQVGRKYWIISATVLMQFLNEMALCVYFILLGMYRWPWLILC